MSSDEEDLHFLETLQAQRALEDDGGDEGEEAGRAHEDWPPRSANGAFRCAEGHVVMGGQLNAGGVSGDKRPAPHDEIPGDPLYFLGGQPPGAPQRGIATPMGSRPVLEAFNDRAAPVQAPPVMPVADVIPQSCEPPPENMWPRPPRRAGREVGGKKIFYSVTIMSFQV